MLAANLAASGHYFEAYLAYKEIPNPTLNERIKAVVAAYLGGGVFEAYSKAYQCLRLACFEYPPLPNSQKGEILMIQAKCLALIHPERANEALVIAGRAFYYRHEEYFDFERAIDEGRAFYEAERVRDWALKWSDALRAKGQYYEAWDYLRKVLAIPGLSDDETLQARLNQLAEKAFVLEFED